jgi:HD domain
MSPAEQAHSYRVAEALLARGESAPDLLVAALLHDVGKTRAPLSLPERVLAVLGRKFAPGWAERMGRAENGGGGLSRAFATAEHHAAWGAEMAAQAGASAGATALIRLHQTAPPVPPRSEADRQLAALREADDEA